MQATLIASWTPSTSPGIVSQTITLTVNGTKQPPVVLGAGASSASFAVNEKDVCHVDLLDSDGVLSSATVSADLTVPEVTPPASPTNLTLKAVPVGP